MNNKERKPPKSSWWKLVWSFHFPILSEGLKSAINVPDGLAKLN